MAMVKRIEAGDKSDRQAMLAMLRQIHKTLLPLSKIDRREKLGAVSKGEERGSAMNNSH